MAGDTRENSQVGPGKEVKLAVGGLLMYNISSR
jgi:hypothetical protein